MPPHPLVLGGGGGGGGTLAYGRGVGGVPIPTRGHTLLYSVYISTLCCYTLRNNVSFVTINVPLIKKLLDIIFFLWDNNFMSHFYVSIFMYPSAVVYCCCVLLSVVGCSCVLLCVRGVGRSPCSYQWWAKLLRLLTVNSLSYFVKIKY